MSQIFSFLQIPESLNSAILCKFYFLKFYLLPKIVIRDEPGIKISKKGLRTVTCLISVSYNWVVLKRTGSQEVLFER